MVIFHRYVSLLEGIWDQIPQLLVFTSLLGRGCLSNALLEQRVTDLGAMLIQVTGVTLGFSWVFHREIPKMDGL